MKRTMAFLLALPLLLLTSVAGAAPAVEVHGALSVQDGRVVDAHGEPLSIAGPSLFWGNRGWGDRAGYPPAAYYNADVVAYVNREWNAPIIRISMGSETPGGYIEDPVGRWDKIARVARAAIHHGMYFIVDWHSHHAEDNPDDAVRFFERVAGEWGDTPNLIYEIYNEPLRETSWPDTIKPYSARVISAIRRIDPDNLIVVGTRSWSQDVDEAADDPITGFDNLAYTLHFYAGTHREELRDKALYAIEKKLPLMVTEWGSVSATGDGRMDAEETRRWMAFLKAHRLSHCNWSLHSKREAASILSPRSSPHADWTEANLSPAGKLFHEIIMGWHETDYRHAHQ